VTTPAVDLVINTWERTYRDVLAPGVFTGIAAQSRFPFAGRVALLNNIDDLDDARRRAQALIDTGELTAFHVVEDELDAALATTGLTRRDLARAPHYTNCAIVAVTVAGSPWLVYWDAEVELREPVDWITPSIALIERDARVLVANPNQWNHPEPGPGNVELRDGFAIGRGFSDQLFLARRADLARPIYGERHLAGLRYPMANVTRVFEQRLDCHMRRHGLLRASHLGSAYVHPPAEAGASYPGQTRAERARGLWQRAVLAALRATPRRVRPPTLRDV
jgi:hypothetical protein